MAMSLARSRPISHKQAHRYARMIMSYANPVTLDRSVSCIPQAFPACCGAEYGKVPKFRLDKQALEATTERQLKVCADLPLLDMLCSTYSGQPDGRFTV